MTSVLLQQSAATSVVNRRVNDNNLTVEKTLNVFLPKLSYFLQEKKLLTHPSRLTFKYHRASANSSTNPQNV